MHERDDILIFLLDSRRYALRLETVERVLRAVEIEPVPMAPGAVRGIINVQGRVIPVLSIRKLFRLPERELGLNDRLIIVRTKERAAALPVDDVSGVLEGPARGAARRETLLPEVDSLEGVIALDDGMVLIYDLDRFLFAEEGAAPAPRPFPGETAAAAEEQEAPHD